MGENYLSPKGNNVLSQMYPILSIDFSTREMEVYRTIKKGKQSPLWLSEGCLTKNKTEHEKSGSSSLN